MSDYPEVQTVKDLPPANEHAGETYRVLQALFDVYYEQRKIGLHYSDGFRWHPVKKQITFEMLSRPPSGKCELINLYVDPETNKLVVEFDDQPVQ